MSILDDKEPVSLAQQLAANKDVDGLVKLIEGMATKAMSLIERCDKAEEDSRVKEIGVDPVWWTPTLQQEERRKVST